MKVTEYQEKIEFWAEARGLNRPEFAQRQCSKVMEEVGEFAGNLVRGNCVKDDIGDIFVTIVILAKQKNIQVDFSKNELSKVYLGDPIKIYSLVGLLVSCKSDIQFKNISTVLVRELMSFCVLSNICFIECIKIAWNEIKTRRGKMVNGTFIKEADLVS